MLCSVCVCVRVEIDDTAEVEVGQMEGELVDAGRQAMQAALCQAVRQSGSMKRGMTAAPRVGAGPVTTRGPCAAPS